MKHLRPLVAVAAAALSLAACGSSGAGAPSSSPTSQNSSAEHGGGTKQVAGAITVYAAASLTDAFGTLKTQFEKRYPGTSVTLRFDASSTLATQIQQGAPVDVFASASTKNMQQIGTEAVDAQTFASNVAEIAVPAKNPGKITKLADLAKPGVSVAVCDAAVPCGVLATQVFAKAKLSVKPKAFGTNVSTTLAYASSGQADASIVYVTDVRSAGKSVKGIAIPTAVNASTAYPIARLKDARNTPVAEAWVQFVLGATGQAVLKADGFRPA